MCSISRTLDDEFSIQCSVVLVLSIVKRQLNIGVPQGSVLGPILFLLYVNDINMHVDLGACNWYADDTLVYCSANNVNELQECRPTQKCVTAIKEWYDNNRLVINA